jgi:hypothetical protein
MDGFEWRDDAAGVEREVERVISGGGSIRENDIMIVGKERKKSVKRIKVKKERTGMINKEERKEKKPASKSRNCSNSGPGRIQDLPPKGKWAIRPAISSRAETKGHMGPRSLALG